MLDTRFIKRIKETVEDTKLLIEGGSDPRARKVRKISYVFLTMPDPTSVSTMIGITLFTTSKILEKRRVKGLRDYLVEYQQSVLEAKRLLEQLSI